MLLLKHFLPSRCFPSSSYKEPAMDGFSRSVLSDPDLIGVPAMTIERRGTRRNEACVLRRGDGKGPRRGEADGGVRREWEGRGRLAHQ